MAESSVAADSVEGSACSSPPVISSSDSSEKETPVRSVSPLTPVSLLDKLRTPKVLIFPGREKCAPIPPSW